MDSQDPYGVTDRLESGNLLLRVYSASHLPSVDPARLSRRPRTIRILLENMLRHGGEDHVAPELLLRLAHGEPLHDVELPFHPERILLQDFTGVPVIVDLTALRSAAERRKLDPSRINPKVPVDLVVDHSVQVDSYGSSRSLFVNLDREYARNGERYGLLRWSQSAFDRVRVIPPGNGIVHQVNLEYLASVVTRGERAGKPIAFPDTLLGTDSHTTMVNGLGVLGWGVGGIEAEAAMLGEPYFLPTPKVVGVRLSGRLPEGTTATDLVLTVTRKLREHGVVDKFVEFFGPGLSALSVPDRATISNMCPEYGATSALFPVDEATLAYLRGTNRAEEEVALVEAYAKQEGLWNDHRPMDYDEQLEVDLGSIVPTIAGPGNPEESVALSEAAPTFRRSLESYRKSHPPIPPPNGGHTYPADDPLQGIAHTGPSGGTLAATTVADGSVVIAAITSCTNTSNPSVMVGAGLIAKRAHERGLKVPPHVKTSLAPGSKVVTDYLGRAGLLAPLEAMGFAVVGFGCTTCIGNSGPLPPPVEEAVKRRDLYVSAVLSGNRNFEARIHNLVRANFLMSPMLVVAYGLAGRMDLDLTRDPLGIDAKGQPVLLRELWPSAEEIRGIVDRSLEPAMFREKYASILDGGPHWNGMAVPPGKVYPWDAASTYLREPPYFDLPAPALPQGDIVLEGARVLAVLGDRVSTDHISPAGEIPADSPAGAYLIAHGVAPEEFNTYGTRRGNHEVMIRGTFANVRLKNRLVAPQEGGFTTHFPGGERRPIFEAAEQYRRERVPLIVLAGKSYGQGSSRDWAAKGPRLLGVSAVIAESFERIHRSNLVGMGVLPLEFLPGESAASLGLRGSETFSLRLAPGTQFTPRVELEVVARDPAGKETRFRVRSRIDREPELEYYRSGGLLPYIVDHLAR
ncbi:MAG TPA: aconitate hydratase AcnA [Thermoplasmata archaeon]|nr:aconitate hydratase AcnA [Thermoplasmata archaeon]